MTWAIPKTLAGVVTFAFIGLAIGGCSDGDGGDPGLDRIDGPAQVDEDVVVTGSTGGSTDESGG